MQYAQDIVLTLTAKVSFSFTIGTTPICRSSVNVLAAFRYWLLCPEIIVSRCHSILQNELRRHPRTYINDIIPCQEDLGYRLSQLLEQFIPKRNKTALSHSSNRLISGPEILANSVSTTKT